MTSGVPQASASVSDIKMEDPGNCPGPISDHMKNGTELQHGSIEGQDQKQGNDGALLQNCDEREGNDEKQEHDYIPPNCDECKRNDETQVHDHSLLQNCDEREENAKEKTEEEATDRKECEDVNKHEKSRASKDDECKITKRVKGDKDAPREDRRLHNARKDAAKGKMRVPDGGWGWMVAIGAFVTTFLLISQATCFGILFSQYLLREGVSSVTTAWIFNVLMLVWHCMMPLVGPLSQEFGARTVAFTATGIAIVATIISAFTPSPHFLYFSTSVLTGIGAGLAVGLSYIIVSPYFNKRRGLANAIMVAGSPIGQMAMAPLVRYLLDQYTFKGATLVYSGLLMHAFIGIAFYHPLKWHMKPVEEERGEAGQTLLPQESDCPRHQNPDHHSAQSLSQQDTSHSTGNLKQTHISAIKKELIGPSGSGSCISLASADICQGVAPPSVMSSLNKSEDSLSSTKKGVIMRLFNTFGRVARTTVSNLSLLKSLRVCIIASTFMMGSVSFLNFTMIIPFAMQAAGHQLQDAAWCISILGVANLLIRFVVSPLSDWKRFSIRVCFIVGHFLKAFAVIGFAFSLQVGYSVVWTGMFGLGLGMTISMQALVIVWYMGIDLLPATFGITGIVAALGFPIIGPIIGVIRDITESYQPSLWLVAALDILSLLLWLPMPAAVARDLAREKEKKERDKNENKP